MKKRRRNFFFISLFLKNRDEIKKFKTYSVENFYLHVPWRKPRFNLILHNAGTLSGAFFLLSKRCLYSDFSLTFSIPLLTIQREVQKRHSKCLVVIGTTLGHGPCARFARPRPSPRNMYFLKLFLINFLTHSFKN